MNGTDTAPLNMESSGSYNSLPDETRRGPLEQAFRRRTVRPIVAEGIVRRRRDGRRAREGFEGDLAASPLAPLCATWCGKLVACAQASHRAGTVQKAARRA